VTPARQPHTPSATGPRTARPDSCKTVPQPRTGFISTTGPRTSRPDSCTTAQMQLPEKFAASLYEATCLMEADLSDEPDTLHGQISLSEVFNDVSVTLPVYGSPNMPPEDASDPICGQSMIAQEPEPCVRLRPSTAQTQPQQGIIYEPDPLDPRTVWRVSQAVRSNLPKPARQLPYTQPQTPPPSASFAHQTLQFSVSECAGMFILTALTTAMFVTLVWLLFVF
ncbi:MAG: hypothetical protein AAFS10_25900, partial [Myxococcota bacterium]